MRWGGLYWLCSGFVCIYNSLIRHFVTVLHTLGFFIGLGCAAPWVWNDQAPTIGATWNHSPSVNPKFLVCVVICITICARPCLHEEWMCGASSVHGQSVAVVSCLNQWYPLYSVVVYSFENSLDQVVEYYLGCSWKIECACLLLSCDFLNGGYIFDQIGLFSV